MLRTARDFECLMKELFAKHGLSFDKAGAKLTIEDPEKTYMPLAIERLTRDTVGVMHFYIQNGDVMRDPDIVFWTPASGGWYPLEYQQDNLSLYWEIGTVQDGKLRFRPTLYNDILSFTRTWAKNLREQGFLKFDATVSREGGDS